MSRYWIRPPFFVLRDRLLFGFDLVFWHTFLEMFFALLFGTLEDEHFGLVMTERLMRDQIRYAGSLWDVSVWMGPGRQGHRNYVEIRADGKRVFSTEELDEPSRIGIGFLSGADRIPYIVFREYASAGSGAWTKIFTMKAGGRLTQIFEEENYDNVFHTARDLGGPVFRDLDGDGREEWIWDDFSSYDNLEGAPRNLIAFKLNSTGVLKVWRVFPNRNNIWLPRLTGIATEGDRQIYFLKHGHKWFK